MVPSKAVTLIETAAALRDKAEWVLRLAGALTASDQVRLGEFANELREQASELERQAAAQTPQRPAEPGRDATKDGQKPKKGRGGSNDPEPQS